MEWKIISIPRLMGTISMNVVPKIPFLKRLFNPKSHRFLVFDAFFYPKDKPELLFQLLESTLVEQQRYSGLLWLDEEDKYFQALNQLNQWGILDKVEGRFPVSAIAKFHGLSNDGIEANKRLPIYVAGFDNL